MRIGGVSSLERDCDSVVYVLKNRIEHFCLLVRLVNGERHAADLKGLVACRHCGFCGSQTGLMYHMGRHER